MKGCVTYELVAPKIIATVDPETQDLQETAVAKAQRCRKHFNPSQNAGQKKKYLAMMHIYYRLVHRQEKYRMPSQYSLRWNITKIPLSIVVFALVCVLSARDEEGRRLIPETDQA
jgi:hypothetical protein